MSESTYITSIPFFRIGASSITALMLAESFLMKVQLTESETDLQSTISTDMRCEDGFGLLH